MPVYEYRCRTCETELNLNLSIEDYERLTSDPQHKVACVSCHLPMTRTFSFAMKPMMKEHYNNSTGQNVTSERQFKDQLKIKSEEATVRTGIEHNFVPVDHQEKEKLGVTNEGLAATYDRRKKLGMAIPDVIKPGNMD